MFLFRGKQHQSSETKPVLGGMFLPADQDRNQLFFCIFLGRQSHKRKMDTLKIDIVEILFYPIYLGF